MDLASDQAASDALAVQGAVAGSARFSLEQAADASGLINHRSRAALTWLGIHGHIGFDAADNAYFWRRLPYPGSALASDPARLRDAKALVDAHAVRLAGDGTCTVRSEDREYRARVGSADYHCTCPWISKHGTTRGPCKHVLAAAIVQAPVRPERVEEVRPSHAHGRESTTDGPSPPG
jgi:hypothetical protein